MTDCISVAYVAWGVVWAVWELFFYTVSQHQEWSLFKSCEEIETGRLKAETWERALRGVVRSVIDGMCECDLEGIILRASPQFAELIGMEQFHLVGQSLSSLCLNAECDRVSTFIQQCVRGDQLATATTIETILCGKPDGECLRLSLFVGAEVMRRVTMTRPTLTLRLQCAAGVIASRCRVVVEVSLPMVHTIVFETA